MRVGDRIISKHGRWRKGRFATIVAVGKDGDFLARFGTKGKYFGGWAKDYLVIREKNIK